jgi:response regulator NasT
MMNVLIVSCKDEVTAAVTSALVKAGVLAENIAVTDGRDTAGYDLVFYNLPLEGRFGLDEAVAAAQSDDVFVVAAAAWKHIEKIIEKIGDTSLFLMAKPFPAGAMELTLRNIITGYRKRKDVHGKLIEAELKIADIKLIDRAKFVLAEYLNLTEAEAHRYIQKNAMDRRVRQTEIAKDILRTYEIN